MVPPAVMTAKVMDSPNSVLELREVELKEAPKLPVEIFTNEIKEFDWRISCLIVTLKLLDRLIFLAVL